VIQGQRATHVDKNPGTCLRLTTHQHRLGDGDVRHRAAVNEAAAIGLARGEHLHHPPPAGEFGLRTIESVFCMGVLALRSDAMGRMAHGFDDGQLIGSTRLRDHTDCAPVSLHQAFPTKHIKSNIPRDIYVCIPSIAVPQKRLLTGAV
jgi:hypothetical protein